MTKVDAIQKLLQDRKGVASLNDIYENIEKYYPLAKNSKQWEAGLRGVLYRAVKEQHIFKKIGVSIYALNDYSEENKPKNTDTVRMHSYIEGICLELGNIKEFKTYTPDINTKYRDNLLLKNIATMKEIPPFSYPEIIDEVKRIDVIWFNKEGHLFPQKVFEVVDSIGTLNNAFVRSLQLENFRTKFYIIGPEKHHEKYKHTINLNPYNTYKDKFTFINYDDIIKLYDSALQTNKLEAKLFGN